MIYELSQDDEESLDVYESRAYAKQVVSVELVPDEQSAKFAWGKTTIDALVYVDIERKTTSQPRDEYIIRMNFGIADALQKGIPLSYIDTYLRPFIPTSSTALT